MLPRLNVSGHVSFLVDTGADSTILMPTVPACWASHSRSCADTTNAVASAEQSKVVETLIAEMVAIVDQIDVVAILPGVDCDLLLL